MAELSQLHDRLSDPLAAAAAAAADDRNAGAHCNNNGSSSSSFATFPQRHTRPEEGRLHNHWTGRRVLNHNKRNSFSKNGWRLRHLLAAALLVSLALSLTFGGAQAAEVAARSRRQSSALNEPTTANDESENTATSTSTSTTTTTTAAPETTTSSTTSKPRIPAVNFTRVSELFESGSDNEPEVVAKWRKLDKTLQSGVGAVLKMVFPHVVSMASDAKVSGNCQGAILKWILNLKNLRTWSVRMLDAIGKPSAGLLEGSLTLFGNYKQCLSVRAPDEDEIEIADGEFKEYFRGQYCVLQIKPPLLRKKPFYSLNSTQASLMRKTSSYKYYEKTVYDDLAELAMAFNFVNIRADLCVPSLCSRDDIQRVADFLVGKLDMRARVQRCDIEPHVEGDGNQQDPSTAISQLDLHHVLWALVLVVLLLLVLVSTLTSVAFKLRNKSQKSKTKSIFTSMSLYRSLAHMKNVHVDRINDHKPAFLYSIRVILLLWIFLVALTSQLNFQFLRELLPLRSIIMLWPLQLIVNSSLAFDSLILLTAFTYAYQNINATLSDLLKYNLAKYARLMPSIMLMVALTILTPLLYQWRSPVWHDFVDEPAQVCRTNGLVNLFFLQNLLPAQTMCLPQTWLFCVELQLCLLAIPIVLQLNKTFDYHQGQFKLSSWPVLALILAALIGCVWNFLNIYQNSLPAAWFLTFPDRDDKFAYMSQHQQRAWAHLTTFAVGLFAGHLCRCQSIETFSGKPYGRQCCNNLMWLTSALTMGALIFGTHSWSLSGVSHLQAPLLSALYGALAPLLWSISLALILFQLTVPNAKNQRSSLTKLLTSDINLIRLGRLSFLAYLINPYVNNFVYAIQEQAIFSSILMLGHTFVGNLVTTFALAFLISALVELPCRRLAKKLLLGSRRHCSNFDIIARQLNIRHQNQGPSHDSFASQQQPSGLPPQKHSYMGKPNQGQASVMIPLK